MILIKHYYGGDYLVITKCFGSVDESALLSLSSACGDGLLIGETLVTQ